MPTSFAGVEIKKKPINFDFRSAHRSTANRVRERACRQQQVIYG